ncbi:hypothetical protein CVS47_02333 [Microbacterium lemovicicum]|uniref:Uncharacterized protein n=1 Tax=Microbacterium lemovicicum TaxID=1072463 RepID=A0A3Q9J0L4_9MICO|nr:hypothetical protein [Microbacterium lemovicicum]AZS37689.1 hypothetical protein CVS47_02333 [Microbacterium lemovicicum]
MSSSVDGELDQLTAAIIAYVGYGSRRTPGADDAAVLALDAPDPEALLAQVKAIVAASDTLHIPREAFGNQNKSILFSAEFEKIWPGLSAEALYALSWRWSYLEFF